MGTNWELKKHILLFNIIALPYNLFFKSQVKGYSRTLLEHGNEFGITKNDLVLDIGCGTGAWSASLEKSGYNVIGMDYSLSMSKRGKKNRQACIQGNALSLPFHTRSIHTITASYVLHGISAGLRKELFNEAKRVGAHQVIFQDYNQRRRFSVDIVEWLEGGDYFNFVKQIEDELYENFGNLRVVTVDKNTNWYICTL
jgi:ubiquinone/menaquinone biosynthesis C-methylase UbiE